VLASDREICEKTTTARGRTPVVAGLETDLICNHNFV
jgi:hypothetical protein